MVAALVCLWWFWSPPGANDLVGGDEGYYGTMARNVLAGPRWLASPSLAPLGPPGDKPFLYPALLAASLRVFGVTEAALRWPSYLLAGLTAVSVGVLLARVAGVWFGVFSALLLMTLPWYGDASRIVAAEIPLAAFGTLALVVVTGRRTTARHIGISAALLGLGFLCKLWLTLIMVVPVVAALLQPGMRRHLLRVFVPVLVGTASLHLLSVVLLRPTDLSHWLTVYFHGSLADRVSGAGYGGAWLKPPAFYWAMMVHAFGLSLPLVATGFEAAARRWREPIPRALILWGLGVVVLSLFSVKNGGYAYPIVPGWAGLAAFGVASVASGRLASWPTLLIFAVGSAPVITQRLAGVGLPVPVWAGVWLGWSATSLLMTGKPAWRPRAALAVGAIVCILDFAREAQRLPLRYHTPGYRVVAETVAPLLAGLPPDRVSVVAPEAPSFSFYLFRGSRYWATPGSGWTQQKRLEFQADTAIKLFVVDTSRSFYGGWPDAAMLGALEDSTREITRAVRTAAGRELPLRVFVRD